MPALHRSRASALAAILVMPLLAGLDAAEAAAPHPLLQQEADRAPFLAQAGASGADWLPVGKGGSTAFAVIRDLYQADYDRHLRPGYLWENQRGASMHRLAALLWLLGCDAARQPTGRALAPGMETLVGVLRVGTAGISTPTRRAGDRIVGPGSENPWGRLLEGSGALFSYAAAFDLLDSSTVRSAGVPEEVLQRYYATIVDGVFHLFVEHLRSIAPGWLADGASGAIGNNWNSREFAAIGMACLAFEDRLLREPADSQRRRDYVDGLDLVRRCSSRYLAGWAATADRDAAYYYESPHYLRYWIDTFLPFAVAHQRRHPEAAAAWPALGLGPDAPLARFMRAHAMSLLVTHRDAAGAARWSNPPWDDNWLYPEDASVPLLMAAAWIDGSADDRRRWIDAAKRAGNAASEALIANPVWNEYERHAPVPLPAAESLPAGGIALLRTGSGERDLMAALKNTPTPADAGVPSLGGHTHADNGQVLAYRDGEPILVDPGYGSEGFSNKRRAASFTNWLNHNVLLVEDATGYADALRAQIGEDGRFVLPFWPDASAPGRRIPRCEARRDGFGELRIAEMDLASHVRTVVVPDADRLLVIDRLRAPKRIKLCWWGNGSVAGSDNPGAPGKPVGGDPDRRTTATIDTAKAEARYFRGPACATTIRVLWPERTTTATREGAYGPWWGPVNLPLTGMLVTSDEAVGFAVTLVDIAHASAAAAAAPQARIVPGKDSILCEITLGGARPLVYAVATDGGIVRRAP